MITLWRIDKARRSRAESFSGAGAALTGGRWNARGVRVVYTSGSLALAALEKFVHLGNEGRRVRWVAYEIRVPADVRVEEADLAALPDNWRDDPPPAATMDLGSRWAGRNRSAILRVPSVVIASESNYLLNPLHADFGRLLISRGDPFRFDDRLWKWRRPHARLDRSQTAR